MTFTPSPCMDCTNRYIGCHSETACPTWAKWHAEETRKKAEINKAKQAERVLQDVQFETSARIHRRVGKPRYRGYSIK
jgi:hypothetical protein